MATLFQRGCRKPSLSARKPASKPLNGVVFHEFDLMPAKPILDEFGRLLAEHYGFTDEEVGFIISYDLKYRMGRGDNG